MDNKEIGALKRDLEASKKLLPSHLAGVLVGVAIYFALEYFFELNVLLTLIILGSAPFAVLVDLINIIHCKAELRKLQD